MSDRNNSETAMWRLIQCRLSRDEKVIIRNKSESASLILGDFAIAAALGRRIVSTTDLQWMRRVVVLAGSIKVLGIRDPRNEDVILEILDESRRLLRQAYQLQAPRNERLRRRLWDRRGGSFSNSNRATAQGAYRGNDTPNRSESDVEDDD